MLSVVSPLLLILNQIKIYHWQTYSFAQHKSLDGAYEALSESIDEFIETYQGIFGRVKAKDGTFNFELGNLDGVNLISKIDEWIIYLKSFDQDAELSKRTDLLNIRDEMLGTLNQLKYLLSLT
jgi:hypothetical protein